VVFTGGGGPAALVGGAAVAVVACREREASDAQAAGRSCPRDSERAAVRRAWQGRQTSAMTRRRSCAVPSKASGRVLCLRGPAAVRSEAASERIRAIGRGTSG
jgi:hypothetical protein